MEQIRAKYTEAFVRLNTLCAHAASLRRDIDWMNRQASCAICSTTRLAGAVAALSHDLSALKEEVDVICAIPCMMISRMDGGQGFIRRVLECEASNDAPIHDVVSRSLTDTVYLHHMSWLRIQVLGHGVVSVDLRELGLGLKLMFRNNLGDLVVR